MMFENLMYTKEELVENKRDDRRIMIAGIIVYLIILFITITILTGIGYIAIHFISKFW